MERLRKFRKGGRMQEEVDKAYDIGYEKGARAVIDAVSNWLDEDTISELRERFLGGE